MHRAGIEPARFSAVELKSTSLTTRTSMRLELYYKFIRHSYISIIISLNSKYTSIEGL